MDKKPTSPGAKALIIGLVMIVVSLGIYLMGTAMTSSLNYLVYLILIVGVIISVIYFGKEVQHTGTFGNYFAHGFKVSAVVALLMIAYLIIFMFMFPDFKDKAMAEIEAQMRADKGATSSQVDEAMKMMNKGFWLFAIGGGLLYNLIAGAIAALIGAAITKKERKIVQDINQIGN